jgi:hypothetical protein
MGATPSREQAEADTEVDESPLVSDIETNEEDLEDLDTENPLNMNWFWPFM